MKNQIKIFENSEFGKIRTMSINNEPWFIAKDVAEILGYGNPRQGVASHVDDEDKGVQKMDTPSGSQNMTIINESGLYSLVLSSKLPTAKKFKRWVTSEVLPSIRKTGGYSIGKANKPTDTNRSKAMLNNSKAKLAKLWLEISHNTQIQEYKDICNAYAANTLAEKEVFALPAVNEKTYTATEIGEMLGVTAAKIGRIANTYGLKTEQYGKYFYDKSKHSSKEVETFRYYKSAIEMFKGYLG